MDLHIFTFWSFWSLSHFKLFLNCAFRRELPMKSDAFESRVLSFNTNSPLGITKVKMCCGPHAVSVTRSVCRTSHEILTFFFCDPRISSVGARKARPFFYTFFKLRKSLVAAVPFKVLTESCCGGGAVNIFFDQFFWFLQNVLVAIAPLRIRC